MDETDTKDRNMRLLEDFWYVDPAGFKWPAPKDSVINGASIPRPLWSVVGSPFTDDYRRASVVHDVACADPLVNRKEADEMFFYACLAGGCSMRQSRILYAGVRIGTWAAESLPAEAFSRDRMLFRVPLDVPVPEEPFLKGKLGAIALDFESLSESDGVAQMDTIIARHLKFNNL
ncbi:DUF1353 domain-containing protein [Candidimonas sp. SYP-B2681]|uniref:DUF1353 domain-containing protein n=1 Tax=Candidimonas sp. SYP-B2681 TaxID=2497686 RepID=UPI001315524D|nr:DUF1353 domain-containing protein [Candidimonas sp. SYP-B2681]